MSSTNEPKNILKFCYRGALSQIVYGASCGYHDIIAMVIKHYGIPADFSDCLQISNLNGYVFGKQVFEYFILLFPNPEIVFYVRPGYKSYKWSNNKSSVNKEAGQQPFSNSGVNKNNNLKVVVDKLYGAPVRRQNCFLGSLPVTTKSKAKQHSEVKLKRLIAKRQRLNEEKSVVTPARIPKRSIRV